MFPHRAGAIFTLAIVVVGGCSMAERGRKSQAPVAPAIAPETSPVGTEALASPSDATSNAGALAIDPRNTSIGFVGAALMNKQPGSFERFRGSMELGSDDPRDARLTIEIDMDSVSTRIPLLTKHLKRADFLDVEHFPKATFVSTRIEPSADGNATHVITGDMTIHGVTRTLAIPATIRVSADRVALQATIPVRQSEFGMEKAAKKTDDLVPVTVAIQIARD